MGIKMNESKRQTCGDCKYIYTKDCLRRELCLHPEECRLYTGKNSEACRRFEKENKCQEKVGLNP